MRDLAVLVLAILLTACATSPQVAEFPLGSGRKATMSKDGTTSYRPLDPNSAKQLSFQSQNCVGFGTNAFKCSDLQMKGFLFTPSAPWDKVVVVSHGSQGLDSRVFEYADALTKNGIAALVLDHFGPRNVGPVHGDYAGYSAKGANAVSMAGDAIWAVEALKAEYPNINSIGYLGESMGGITATTLAKPWIYVVFDRPSFIAKLSNIPFFVGFTQRPFKAAVALYPGCLEDAEGERFLDVPLLMVLGEKDDNTPAQLCVNYRSWVNARGGNANVVVLAGEHHGFDAPHAKQYVPRAQNPSKCHRRRVGSELILTETGKSYPGSFEGQLQLTRDCMGWGVTGGHQEDKFVGVPYWLAHFQQHLQTKPGN
jgi:dienelactone hydrolase